MAHDLGTPNNRAWLEGIQRECASWDNIADTVHSALVMAREFY